VTRIFLVTRVIWSINILHWAPSLGHVQHPSLSRLRAVIFTENPPPRASDGRAVVSRKDVGGSYSQVLSTSLATLHAQSTAKVDPVRRLCGNMAPRIDPDERAATRPPWRDVIPKLGPAREEWEGHLQMEQRRGDNTCSFEEGGRPACQRRSSRGGVARHHSSPTESSSAAAAAASRDSRRERWLGWEEQAKSVQAAAKRAPPRALVSDVLAGAEGREALGWGSDERREEGDR
jgi:hypothetical protein